MDSEDAHKSYEERRQGGEKKGEEVRGQCIMAIILLSLL